MIEKQKTLTAQTNAKNLLKLDVLGSIAQSKVTIYHYLKTLFTYAFD